MVDYGGVGIRKRVGLPHGCGRTRWTFWAPAMLEGRQPIVREPGAHSGSGVVKLRPWRAGWVRVPGHWTDRVPETSLACRAHPTRKGVGWASLERCSRVHCRSDRAPSASGVRSRSWPRHPTSRPQAPRPQIGRLVYNTSAELARDCRTDAVIVARKPVTRGRRRAPPHWARAGNSRRPKAKRTHR